MSAVLYILWPNPSFCVAPGSSSGLLGQASSALDMGECRPVTLWTQSCFSNRYSAPHLLSPLCHTVLLVSFSLSTCIHLCAQGLLPAAEEKQSCHGDVGRLFVFAVMWSLGALLELEDRTKMEAFLKVCECLSVLSCWGWDGFQIFDLSFDHWNHPQYKLYLSALLNWFK